MKNRRQFFKMTALAAAGFGQANTIWAAGGLNLMKDRSLDELNCALFAAQLQTKFRLPKAFQGETIELLLTEATDLTAGTPGAKTQKGVSFESFSLIFSGPLDKLLPQGTYPFEHPAVGRFHLFIVPVTSRDKEKLHYQAIFNRPARTKNNHNI